MRAPTQRFSTSPWIHRLVDVSFRRPGWVLAGPIALTIAALPFASSLRLDTDLRRLLPPSYPTVREMDRVLSKLGDMRYFSILIESGDVEQSARFADALVARLRESPDVRSVLYRRPVDFLQKYGLLLLPIEKLRELRAFVSGQRVKHSPFDLGLGDPPAASGAPEASPSAALNTIKAQYAAVRRMSPYYLSKDGRLMGIQVRPRFADNDLSRVRAMHRNLLDAIRETQARGGYPGMAVHVSGSMKHKIDEVDVMLHDILSTSWMSLALILLILLVSFRNPLRMVPIVVPLACGLTWAFGVVALGIGFLSVFSAVICVALFGLGIDHGIHLMKGYLRRREDTDDPRVAMGRTLQEIGPSVLISAVTAAAGFLVMILADFKGLSHLGTIAGGAMIPVTLAYFLMMPALVFLLDRRDLLHARQGAAIGRGLWEAAGAWLDKVPRGAGAVAAVALLLGGTAAALHQHFNYDFESLTASLPDSERIRAKQTQVYPEELTPGAVFLAPDAALLDRLLDELKRRRDNDPDLATIGRIASLRDFMPADQPERLREIQAAARLITPAVLEKTADVELRDLMEELRSAARLDPIGPGDVPEVAREFFLARDGAGDHAVFVFPTVPRKQGDKAIAFAADMAPVEVGGHRFFATGDMMIFAETLRESLTQGRRIFVLALGLIGVLLLAQLRRFIDALRVFGTLLAGLGLMLAGLLAVRVDINFYNFVLLAGIVGMGVEYSVYLYLGWLRARANPAAASGRSCAAAALSELGGPITSCALTTCAGYLGMVVSYHPALHGIGMLALIGLTACVLVALTVLPLYLKDLERPS